MKRSLFAVVCAGLLSIAPGEAAAYQAAQGPTETRLWDPTRAFDGYTLFAAHGKTYLVDMAGRVVHQWNVGTNPKLLEDGSILDASKDDPSGFGGFQRVDWDGKVVWEYTESRKDYAPHHDFVRTYNKKLSAWTTMYIANRTITQDQAIGVGADPANGPYDGAQVDAIVEVDDSGTVVWEWWFLDHVVQTVAPDKSTYAGVGKTVADWPGRLDVNLPGRPLRKDWLHCNSMDYNEDLDQVVINAVQGEFVVVDHGNTFVAGDPAASIALAAGPKGDFLYRYGDPARYERGEPPSIPDNWTTSSSGHKQIGGAHDIHWIRPGLPGAGHFLVFNNGQYLFEATNQSYADEIAPFLDKSKTDTGQYVDPPSAGYTVYEGPKDQGKPKRNLSNQLTWRYGSLSPSGMASHIGGSAQRLPNGNTLICADTEGHFLEVTAGDADHAPELVWEYISPVTKDLGALRTMPDAIPMLNSVFRAYRFAKDDPAFSGKTLTAGPTITGADPFSADAGAPAADAGSPGADAGSSGCGGASAGSPDAAAPDAGGAVGTTGPGGVCMCPDSCGGCRTSGSGSGAGGALLALVASALLLATRAARGRGGASRDDR
jgi:hypothetical protein